MHSNANKLLRSKNIKQILVEIESQQAPAHSQVTKNGSPYFLY